MIHVESHKEVDGCTIGKTLYAEHLEYSAKAEMYSAKGLPSVKLDEGHSAYPWPAKRGMPSVISQVLGKPYVEYKTGVLGRIK